MTSPPTPEATDPKDPLDPLSHTGMVKVWASDWYRRWKPYHPGLTYADIEQETYLLLLHCMERWSPDKGTLSNYFYRACANHAKRILASSLGHGSPTSLRESKKPTTPRKWVGPRAATPCSVVSPLSQPADILIDREERETLQGALDLLRDPQEEALMKWAYGKRKRSGSWSLQEGFKQAKRWATCSA